MSIPLYFSQGLLTCPVEVCGNSLYGIVDTGSSKLIVLTQCPDVSQSEHTHDFESASVITSKTKHAQTIKLGKVSLSGVPVHVVDHFRTEATPVNIVGIGPANELGITRFTIAYNTDSPSLTLSPGGLEGHHLTTLPLRSAYQWVVVSLSFQCDKEPWRSTYQCVLDSGSTGIFVPISLSHWSEMVVFDKDTKLGNYYVDHTIRAPPGYIVLGLPFFHNKYVTVDYLQNTVDLCSRSFF